MKCHDFDKYISQEYRVDILNFLSIKEYDPFSPKQSMVVTYDGIELENIRNESFYDCRGYNCGISKFKGLPSMDVKRNFEERWQKLSTNRDTIMTDLYLTRYKK